MNTSKRRSRSLLAGAALLAAAVAVIWATRVPSPLVGEGRHERSECGVRGPLSPSDQTAALLARHYPRSWGNLTDCPTNESPLRFTPNPDGPGFVPDQRALAEIENDARARLAKPGWHPVDPAKYVRPVLPDTFAESVRVRTGANPQSSIPNPQWEVRARPVQCATGGSAHQCASAPARVASDGTLVYKDAFPGCDVAYRASALKTEEFIVIRSEDREIGSSGERNSEQLSTQDSALRTFSWDLDVPAGLTPRLTPAHTIDFVDSKSVPRLRINAPDGKDAAGKLLRAGDRLRITMEGNRVTLAAHISGLQLPIVIDPSWSSTGNMAVGRGSHTATRLANGTILAVGGMGGVDANALVSCEIYDPTTGIWSLTGSMSAERYAHTATLLADGRVLVAGGASNPSYVDTCEVYDPVGKTWSATGAMTTARYGHAATLLAGGEVLVVGNTSLSASSETYDAGTGIWTATGAMTQTHTRPIAVILLDGRVLVVGEGDTTSEVFSPGTRSWTATNPMQKDRQLSWVTRFDDGTVLVTGGSVPSEGAVTATCEVFDPTSDTWCNTGSMTVPRVAHTGILPGRAGPWWLEDRATVPTTRRHAKFAIRLHRNGCQPVRWLRVAQNIPSML